MTRRTEDILDGIVIAAAAGTILRIFLSPFWWTGRAMLSSAVCLLIAILSVVRITIRAIRSHGSERERTPAINPDVLKAVGKETGGEPLLLRWETDPAGTLTATIHNAGHTLCGRICRKEGNLDWHCLISDDGRPIFESDAKTIEDARKMVVSAMSKHVESI